MLCEARTLLCCVRLGLNGVKQYFLRAYWRWQVHFSWIFLPWHRLYLYFHERILASLVGDPSFSLVFWNWDDQVEGGNLFPDMFSWPTTSLYDIFRDPSIMHNATAIADLVPLLNATNPRQIVLQNLNSMYRTMVCASIPELFVGGPYR